MRTTYLLLAAIAIMAMALSACGPAGSAGYPAPAPSMSVTGNAQIGLTPDVAYIYIGVHTEAPEASQAVSANNTNTQKVIDALKNFGVSADDIRTTNFAIWPYNQVDPQTGLPLGTTYAVDNTVYITVRDISKLGGLLDSVVSAGATNIQSIQFDKSDKTADISLGRKAAVENAKKQAEELASAAGVKLGKIISISYYDSTPYPAYDTYSGKGGGGSAEMSSVPIQPGQLQLTVSVSITYELK
jgi:uncharacterized protein YggE